MRSLSAFSPTYFFSNFYFLAALVVVSFVMTHSALACVEDHTVDFKLNYLSASVSAGSGKIECNDEGACDLHFIACIKGVIYEVNNDGCTQFYNGPDKNKVYSGDLHRGNLNRKYYPLEDELTLTLIVLDTDDDTDKSEYKDVYKEAKQRRLYGQVTMLWYEELILNTSAGSRKYSKSLFAIKHLQPSYHNKTKIDINFDITITREDCTTTTTTTAITTINTTVNTSVSNISTTSTVIVTGTPTKTINMKAILIGGFSVLGITCLVIIVCFIRTRKTSRTKPSGKRKRPFDSSAPLPPTAYDMSVFQTSVIPLELPKQLKQTDTMKLEIGQRGRNTTCKKSTDQYNLTAKRKCQDPTLRNKPTKVNKTVTEQEPASIFASSFTTKHPFSQTTL